MNGDTHTTTQHIIRFLILTTLVITVLYILTARKTDDNGIDIDAQKNADLSGSVPIQSEFENKIVYTTNASANIATLRTDCNNRGGTFNECGNTCSNDAELCIDVCAYTCDGLPLREKITSFKECLDAGYPVMESYPRQCRARNVTFVEAISADVFHCPSDITPNSSCIAVVEPVCATVNIQCITTPCNPVQQTYNNSCEACRNDLVETYTSGACEDTP